MVSSVLACVIKGIAPLSAKIKQSEYERLDDEPRLADPSRFRPETHRKISSCVGR